MATQGLYESICCETAHLKAELITLYAFTMLDMDNFLADISPSICLSMSQDDIDETCSEPIG